MKEGGLIYYTNITVGTPPQNLTVQVDTGSNSLIVETPQISTAQGGTYDPKKSSSYQYVNSNLNTTYADTAETGDWVSDTATIGNITLPKLMFGAARQRSVSYDARNILGIGTPISPYIANPPVEMFPPFYMAKLGYIPSPSYSLWLNDIDASSGSLIFGGVDKSKYSGNLSSLPMLLDSGIHIYPSIAVAGLYLDDGVSITNATNPNNGTWPLTAILDSGSAYMTLPLDAVQPVYTKYNVTANYNSSLGSAICDCDLADNNLNATIGFNFGGSTTIFVSLRDLVFPAPPNEPFVPSLPSGKCYFGIWQPVYKNIANGGETLLFGDPFLRNAYVVFDFGSWEIGLAQANKNATAPPQYYEIKSSLEESIPGAQNVSVTQSAVVSSMTSSSTSSSTGTSSTGSSESPTGGAPATTSSPPPSAGSKPVQTPFTIISMAVLAGLVSLLL